MGCGTVLVACLLFVFPLQAAEITVCAAGCDSPTIQGAITAAESGDTIQLLFLTTHTEADIIVNEDVTIEGLDKIQTIVQAAETPQSESGRVFTILDGYTVVLRDFTIRHGDASPGDGGGIWIQASSDPAALVTLERITLHDNRGSGGGAVANEARLQMSDFAIRANVARNSRGGGLFNSGHADLLDGIITGNAGGTRGGGIYSGDVADSPQLALRNVTVENNEAGDGGGIYNRGDMTISGSTISVNRATDQRGGGIYNDAINLVTIENTGITSNGLDPMSFTTSHEGAGIYTRSPVSIAGSAIRSNRQVNPSRSVDGGGLFLDVTAATIVDTFIAFNAASTGAGIYNLESELSIERSAIFDNEAARSGGGLEQISGESRLVNVTVADNMAGSSGGGIYVCTGDLSLVNSTVVSNVADTNGNGSSEGGGAYLLCPDTSAEVRSSIIAGNSVQGGGEYPDCQGTLRGSFSLIGDTGPASGDRCEVSGFTSGMIYGQSPQFGSLQGSGFDVVYPLTAGSVAIDAGSCTDGQGGTLTTDQRGYVMPIDGDNDLVASCDMGAYEFGSNLPMEVPLFKDDFGG